MTPLHKFPITGKEIHKLPPANDHLKEKYKISFLRHSISRKLIMLDDMKPVSFAKSSYDGVSWKFQYVEDCPPSCELSHFISTTLATIEFKNKPINENVYFYRYLNVVRSIVGEKHFSEVIRTSDQYGDIYVSNINEYLSYRSKISEMMNVLG